VPQDFDSLLARFLPTSAAAGIFITAEDRISSSVQPELRACTARIIRLLEERCPQQPGAFGEYQLLDFDNRKFVLVSSTLRPGRAVSLLFAIETSFDDIQKVFSELSKLSGVPEMPDLNGLKARKNSVPGPQNWQEALFSAPSENEATQGLPFGQQSQPDDSAVGDGWLQFF